MKKINLLLIAVLVSAVGFMTSCDGEDQPEIIPKPVITFTSTHDAAVMPGTTVTITGDITAEGELEKVTFFEGTSAIGDPITSFDEKTTYSFSVDVTADETFTFEVQVEDGEGQIEKGTVTITVQDVTVTEYTVTLGDTGDTEGSFIDLATGQVYTISSGDYYAGDNQDAIDLFYFYGSTYDAGFYSPEWAVTEHSLNSFADLANWTTRHTTLFTKTTTADYSTIDYVGLTDGLTDVTSQEAQFLADGDLVFFKLDDGRCGLINVATVVAPGKNVKEINFSYKLQEVAPMAK